MINFLLFAPVIVIFYVVSKYRQNTGWLNIARFLAVAWLGVVIIIATFPYATLKSVGVKIEREEFKQERGGVVYISWSQTYINSNSFYINESTRVEDLTSFINKSKKKLYLIIRKEDDILYSAPIGNKEDVTADTVLSYYNSYIRDGSLPNPRTRYTFLIFYLYL